jgi:hypothetical protein
MKRAIEVIVAVLMLGLPSSASAYLHPQLGRFMQRDPLGYVDGMNLYHYQRGNSTKYRDASGRIITVDRLLGSMDWEDQTGKDSFAELLKIFQGLCPCVEFSYSEPQAIFKGGAFTPKEQQRGVSRRLQAKQHANYADPQKQCDCFGKNPGCGLVYDLMRSEKALKVATTIQTDLGADSYDDRLNVIKLFPTEGPFPAEFDTHDIIDILAHELTHAYQYTYFPEARETLDTIVGTRPNGSQIRKCEFGAVRGENQIAIARGHKPYLPTVPCDQMTSGLGRQWNP